MRQLNVDSQHNQRFQEFRVNAREGVGSADIPVKPYRPPEVKMLTYMSIVQGVLEHVKYLDWKFNLIPVNGDPNGDLYLQVSFIAPDNTNGELSVQTGRKWLIEYNTHPTQIVQAAWLAVQRALMHEAAEQFTYKNSTVFNRHIDVEALVDAAKQVE